ncbi:RagB/SusD domain protein [Pseudopedobacter saltans DSM 12145]|uniref:RagB/SusD domain protein n=1 Tax=Pseudopedobacter saltans (strain ATCC 51119 / DSM 12145 / JCM 21818 / CCUG 39354 / LMG 10337 / NBRC 100064 / NCIMB 13643) TaxID=762903 RepID=F0S8K6_PSESL|nr:RagB/SusD family nutrient uptake outer membrane protein [Pseudopedobacter saltans]ADY51290.1 RagB/SusD domain protein [Pseudopedobacter saltans DSM 12145]
MKNNIIKYFGALVISLSSASCNKFLDTKPQDFLIVDTYYETEEQLNFALAAVYSKLGEGTLYGGRITRMGMDADEGFYDRSTDIIGVSVYNVYPTDPHVTAFWKTCYEGIYRANLLLKHINKVQKISEANRNAIEGEALFLRGYYYFLLVSNFGGVPLITEPIANTNNTAIPRNTVQEVYTQIVADMEKAEGMVKTIKQIGHGGRVSKSAVRGILARVNLHWAGYPVRDLSRYAEARKWAKMVMDDTGANHKLNPDYRQVFINYSSDKYDIGESIWEVEFWGNTQGVYREAGQIGHYNGIQYNGGSNADPNHGFSYGFLNATGVLWDKYDNRDVINSNDIRRNYAIAPFSLAGNPAKETPRAITPTGIYQRDCGKYRRFYEVVMPKENVYTPINYPLLRFSDVLLMFAEAESQETGVVSQDAIDAVNLVRSRAYGKLMSGRYVKSITVNTARTSGTYTVANTNVTISGGGGQGATAAVATVASSGVASILVTFEGSGYTSVPTVAISSTGTGVGATATAVLSDPTINSDLPVSATASPAAFLTFVQDERARELCFESLRKGDLVRWGKLVENMKIVRDHIETSSLSSSLDYVVWSYRNVSERDVLWPIPSYEMGLNSALTQNKGW